jgi:antitoxin (DNA-binding transcriptional repressor) of toxin-antitoxin stability system
MGKTITQRELRNQSGEIMQALDNGEEFVITRNGVIVGELRPARRRFVSRAALLARMVGAPRVDRERFRADVDALVDQDIEPKS